MKNFIFIIVLILFFISGCSKVNLPNEELTPNPEKEVESSEIIVATMTQEPIATQTQTQTLSPTVPFENKAIEVCSPLTDYPISTLVDMITNPFNPPLPGSDDPHQAVDFSVVDPDLKIALKGSPVQAILPGKVVMVVNDRFPYGNAIVIETAIKDIPSHWSLSVKEMPPPNLLDFMPALTCPTGWNQNNPQSDFSVYILYAHLENQSELSIGEFLDCGDGLGFIGDSGNALAPHLHIEMRYGFSDSIQGSMAHYDVSATNEEMSNYCRWRVSGLFPLLDPMEFLKADSGS